jgi:ATP-dependent helicase HrpB
MVGWARQQSQRAVTLEFSAARSESDPHLMPLSPALPIWKIHDAILGALRTSPRLVLVAPTGSGKTTQVPQMLLDADIAGEKMVVVLQPRRVAARTVATRVAWERQSKLGAEVGYQIRFDDHTSLGTRICFVTEGILLRWLQDDRTLARIGVVVFDEFHERNLLSDVALALVKQLQQTLRPDLALVVMSATLDAEPVATYLDSCPILISEGQSYPVEVRYLLTPDQRPLTAQAAEAVARILSADEPGDILVFMPGRGEINGTLEALRSIRTPERVACLPLHGELEPAEQDRAFASNALRKVIVATNVAETSITIDGIRHVVDSGVARVARYDAERGVGTLFLEPISRASAARGAPRRAPAIACGPPSATRGATNAIPPRFSAVTSRRSSCCSIPSASARRRRLHGWISPISTPSSVPSVCSRCSGHCTRWNSHPSVARCCACPCIRATRVC